MIICLHIYYYGYIHIDEILYSNLVFKNNKKYYVFSLSRLIFYFNENKIKIKRNNFEIEKSCSTI